METFVKENDTERTLSETLSVDGSTFNLTAHTVKALFRRGNTLVEQAATVVGAATDGKVTCPIPDAVLSEVGEWSYEWEITQTSTGKKLSVPTKGYNALIVNPNLK